MSILPDEPLSTAQNQGQGGAERKTLLEEALRSRIIHMEMQPGQVVDEVALAREFGLSRPPVRELMRQLAAEGYLELEANRPARVSPMSYETLRCLFQTAPMIYGATIELAALCASAQDIARLKDIQSRFRKAIFADNTEERVHYNNLFHYEIGKIANNPYLMPSLRRITIDHARLAKTFYRSSSSGSVPEDMLHDMQTSLLHHEQMIEAIEKGDTEAGRKLAQAHWDLSRKRIGEYVTPGGLDISLH